MTAYLDASVVVRKLQREAGSLRDWGQWKHAYSSELLRVEVLRAVDRARLRGALTDNEVADIVMKARAILDGLELIQLSPIDSESGSAVISDAARHVGRAASGNCDAFGGVHWN